METYIKDEILIDCPKCKKMDAKEIGFGFEITGLSIIQITKQCKNCGQEWMEEYKYYGTAILTNE